jgi:hypothetical protein
VRKVTDLTASTVTFLFTNIEGSTEMQHKSRSIQPENAKSGRLRPDGAYVDSGVILEVDVERGVGDINLEMA